VSDAFTVDIAAFGKQVLAISSKGSDERFFSDPGRSELGRSTVPRF
jgi:hypothetical protein